MSGRKYNYFKPRRIASWWCTLEDILWPEKKIVDRIKWRAEGFAKAQIDTAINFGFHVRFDFSNYFGQLHGYYANVCEELHKYGIKFMDHYSCNDIERPRGESEFRKLHENHRHHILLFHDPIAAEHAQYEGHLFNNLCEIDVRDGSRGYGWPYQLEQFCHNNPGFLDLHAKYLKRLMAEVPMDGIEVDDMCDYAGLAACGCKYCRDRFRKDYGHEIPPFGEQSFWGDTSSTNTYTWGNYESPVFRDWIRMKSDSVADHVKMIKKTIGDKPLMTCCSSSGPIYLNGVSLDLEKMMGHLDILMLENCGISINTVNWPGMDAEALQQKDIAEKMGHAPAMAISYTVYEKGGYLGWCLSRFWGVGNWSSTLNQRLLEDPEDARETHEIIGPYNNWEITHSDLDHMRGNDVVEARLVSSRFCRENGWRGEDGREQWDRVAAWSRRFLENNIGYRILRANELSDAAALKSENSPLVMDGLGCVSDAQYAAIKEYLAHGGKAWLGLPFGTHDEKGFKRQKPLSDELLAAKFAGLMVVDTGNGARTLEGLVKSGTIVPALKQVSGDARWTARLRIHPEGLVLHLMNRALVAVPHPEIKDMSGNAILGDIKSASTDDKLEYLLDCAKIGMAWKEAKVISPELGDEKREVRIRRMSDAIVKVFINLDGVQLYATVQEAKAI